MIYKRKFFTSGHVDEQVERMNKNTKMAHLLYKEQKQESVQAEERLAQCLQAYYQVEEQQNAVSLEHAWQRVIQRVTEYRDVSSEQDAVVLAEPLMLSQERTHLMHNDISPRSQGRGSHRRLSMLAAVLVVAFLVGSMATVLKLSHPKTATSVVSHSNTPTTAHTPAAFIGQTISTREGGFRSLTWSPDSKRVAGIIYNISTTSLVTPPPDSLGIWDAVDGQHFVVIPMPGGANANDEVIPQSLAWSPNSQLLAVTTDIGILIVDSQTGHVVRSFLHTVVSAVTTPSTDKIPLVRLLPASGPTDIFDTAWSPDGRLMASVLDDKAFGAKVVQIWNPQTGAVASNLSVGQAPVGEVYEIDQLAWSSDGQYIAANVVIVPTNYNIAYTPHFFVAVWNTSTHQIVSRIVDDPTYENPISWQPASHNIALAIVSTVDFSHATFELWNATTGTLVKRYVILADGNTGSLTLVWSPDGQHFAYVGFADAAQDSTVKIANVASGQTIYTYQGYLRGIESAVES
ncbi:MAG: WD40 repeat domain-containing protein, partial [Ktedonobacteraceae bacterium]